MKKKFNLTQKSKYLFSLISLLFNCNNSVFAQNLTPEKNNLVCQSNLERKINEIINQPATEKATWGIVIKEINAPSNIYQLNADKLLIPASNIKLLITAESLLRWGNNWEIKTPVYLTKNIDNSYNLTIIGKGNPTINNEDLENLAQELKKNKINNIKNLTVVEGYLPSPIINYSWEYSDIYYYFAVPVNSLILNENTVNLNLIPTTINQPIKIQWQDEIAGKQWSIKNQVITGDQESEKTVKITPIFTTSILELTGNIPINSNPRQFWLAIPQPELYFLNSLEKVLNSDGIKVEKSEVIYDDEDYEFKEFSRTFTAIVFSLPFESSSLAELIKIINQDSNNLFAEVLFKHLMLENKRKQKSELFGNFQSKTNTERIFVKLDITEDEYQIKDGSGLSRQNLVTPLALANILEQINNSEYQQTFLNSLAIAGKTGTLKNRLQDNIITDKFYGKTGTLTGVVSLSGYLMRENKQNLIISIIVNNSTEKASIVRQIIDEIMLLLATTNDEC